MNSDHLTKKYFCMLPWTHMHIWPNGNTYMCCGADYTKPIGVINKSMSMQQVWNSDIMKENRLKMINNQPLAECKKCYDIERIGGKSSRQESNQVYADSISIIDTTLADGTVEKINMEYLDVRFSNLCNLRCRTCGPDLSSRWAIDLAKEKPYVINIVDNSPGFYEDLVALLPTVKRIYFAGGEPLITDEHYKILHHLIDTGRAKDIFLTYNTNFSKLSHRGESVLPLWAQFKHVMVGASLDGEGNQAEFIRKELSWDQVLKNRDMLRTECPNVKFFVQVCVSVLNFSKLADTHREFIESGFIDSATDWNMNFLIGPPCYRVQITPEEFRDSVKEKYIQHVSWLHSIGANNIAIQRWTSLIEFLDGPQLTDELTNFVNITNSLDKFRNESFTELFPELKFLMEPYV